MRKALIQWAAASALVIPVALWAGGDQCKSGASCGDSKATLVSTGDEKCTEATAAKSGACCEASKGASLVSTGETKPLEAMKPLAGKWKITGGEQASDATAVEFKVSSGGSVIVETMFPGQPHEMTNIYAMDGDRLLVTHYCAAGNQPRMQMVSNENGVMKFDFVDATNLPDKNKMYMGKLELSMLGPDKIQEKWTSFNNGKEETEHATFTLERVK